jgi:hypothetical protein
MADSREEFHERAPKTQAAQAEGEVGLQRVSQAIWAFRAAIDAARSELAQKQQAWATAADTLETGAAEHVQAWTAGLSDLLSRQATAMVTAANGMVDSHNEAMDALVKRFVERAPQDVAAAAEPVEAALGELGQVAETLEQEISREAGALGSRAAAAVPRGEALEGALDAGAVLA